MDELIDALKPIADIIADVERNTEQPIVCGDRDTTYRVTIDRGELRDIATAVANFQSEHRNLTAELARLRELLANAYTVKPLEWKQMNLNRWEAVGKFCFVWHTTNCSLGTWMFKTPDSLPTPCSLLQDGQRQCEAWHHARVTAPLAKVEVPS